MSGHKSPGTNNSRGVNKTLDTPFGGHIGKGPNNSCKAPFDSPRDLGNGGIPVHSYEDMGAQPAKSVAPALASADGPNRSAAPNRYPMGGGKK